MKAILKVAAGMIVAGIFFLGLFTAGAFFFGYYGVKNAIVPEDTIAGMVGCIAQNKCNAPVQVTFQDGETTWAVASIIGSAPVKYYLTERGRFGVVFVEAGGSTIYLEDKSLSGIITTIKRKKDDQPLEVYAFGDPGFEPRFALSQELYLMAMRYAEDNIVPESIKQIIKQSPAEIAPKYVPKKGDREA